MASYFRIGLLQLLNIIAFVAMIVVNGLADFLPINGHTTGQVSAEFPNLFVPAPITFSIWLVIYSLLLLFCLYQGSSLFEDERKEMDKNEHVVEIIGSRFIISCILNIAWIFAWHFYFTFISVLIMLGLLLVLISIFEKLHALGTFAGRKARWFVYAPFSIYLGWISIATIANITAFLVDIGWNGWNIADWIWACMLIIVGTILGILMLLRRNNTFYALTVAWGLAGIFLQQYKTAAGFNAVAITAMSGAALLLLLSLLRLSWQPLVYKH